jgi:hypothetical protein
MRAKKDCLAIPLRANRGKSEGLRSGSWHVSTCPWVGGSKHCARLGTRPSHPRDKVHEQAWKDPLWSLAETLLDSLFEHPAATLRRHRTQFKMPPSLFLYSCPQPDPASVRSPVDGLDPIHGDGVMLSRIKCRTGSNQVTN